MVNVLFLDEGLGYFDGIEESLFRVTNGEVLVAVAQSIEEAQQLIRDNVFDAIFGLSNFGDGENGGRELMVSAFEKDETTAAIMDVFDLVGDDSGVKDDGSVEGCVEVIRAIFAETVPRIVLMRLERKAKKVLLN